MKSYITKEDYFNKRGIDLNLELKGSSTDNPSNAVNIFISNIEEWILEYLENKYDFDRFELEENTDWQEAFKKAVIHQIDYIRRNGDLTLDCANTYNALSPNAFNVLKNVGMCEIQRQRRSGYYGNRYF